MAGVSGAGFLLVVGERFPFPGRGAPGTAKPAARSPVVDGGST
jgi:hypothetical protein